MSLRGIYAVAISTVYNTCHCEAFMPWQSQPYTTHVIARHLCRGNLNRIQHMSLRGIYAVAISTVYNTCHCEAFMPWQSQPNSIKPIRSHLRGRIFLFPVLVFFRFRTAVFIHQPSVMRSALHFSLCKLTMTRFLPIVTGLKLNTISCGQRYRLHNKLL